MIFNGYLSYVTLCCRCICCVASQGVENFPGGLGFMAIGELENAKSFYNTKHAHICV